MCIWHIFFFFSFLKLMHQHISITPTEQGGYLQSFEHKNKALMLFAVLQCSPVAPTSPLQDHSFNISSVYCVQTISLFSVLQRVRQFEYLPSGHTVISDHVMPVISWVCNISLELQKAQKAIYRYYMWSK